MLTQPAEGGAAVGTIRQAVEHNDCSMQKTSSMTGNFH